MTNDAPIGLVADIGGTNARFAWVDLSAAALTPRAARDLKDCDFPTVLDAIDAYLADAGAPARPAHVVLAVAGPVHSGTARLTNHTWSFAEAELLRHGFRSARLINDYAAQAYGAEQLQPADVRRIGGPEDGAVGTLAVLGAGTGFGASALVRHGADTAVLVTEGGHMAFAPTDELEAAVLKRLWTRFGRVSVERILSGPGLSNLHRAMAEIEGRVVDEEDPKAIHDAARAGDAAARATVERFCAIFGSVAGDFALAYGATGGVFLAGGIAPKMIAELDDGPFRARFEAKGRFEAYMRAIPTRVMMRPDVGLLGAAAELATRLGPSIRPWSSR